MNDPPQNSRPLPARFVAANVAGLEADAIGHRNVHTVGDGVRALDCSPRIILRLAVLRFLVRMPADRRGIEQHVRSLQRRQARALGIPLVPADQRAELSEVRLERFEAEIARREVELLVVQRIVGDVHLAIDARQLAARVDDGRGVVIDARRAPLEQRRDDGDLQLACDIAQALGRRAGNRFGEIEECDVFALAEILRLKQFGQADDLGAFGGGVAHVCDRALQVLFRLGRARHLHDADFESYVLANLISTQECIVKHSICIAAHSCALRIVNAR